MKPFLLLDSDGEELWDFGFASTVSVFGNTGAGKTVFARHAALSWMKWGGTVVIGSAYPIEYKDMEGVAYVCSPNEAVEYGRLADQSFNETGLLIIVDSLSHPSLSAENAAYLDGRSKSRVAWVIISQHPRELWNPAESIGMGRMTQAAAHVAFDLWAGSGVSPGRERDRGTTLQCGPVGDLVERVVPSDAALDASLRLAGAVRSPLPSFPKRFWYASGEKSGSLKA